jgi:hypothetical protein
LKLLFLFVGSKSVLNRRGRVAPEDVDASVQIHPARRRCQNEPTAAFSLVLRKFDRFYRATAHLFYQGIAEKRVRVPPEWDAQVAARLDLGGFSSPECRLRGSRSGELCFELNDFDESCQAPFY